MCLNAFNSLICDDMVIRAIPETMRRVDDCLRENRMDVAVCRCEG